jgi:hypothetical protein
MPQFVFHLSFGDRTCGEGDEVSLPNRTAAWLEARAVVRDLSRHIDEESPSRWTGWSLRVSDEHGEFLSLPISETRSEPAGGHPESVRVAELFREIRARRQETVALLRERKLLRQELAAERTRGRQLRLGVRAILSTAQALEWAGLTAEPDDTRGKPTYRRPHLVVVPGGRMDR